MEVNFIVRSDERGYDIGFNTYTEAVIFRNSLGYGDILVSIDRILFEIKLHK